MLSSPKHRSFSKEGVALPSSIPQELWTSLQRVVRSDLAPDTYDELLAGLLGDAAGEADLESTGPAAYQKLTGLPCPGWHLDDEAQIPFT